MATNRGARTVPDTSTTFGLLGSLLNTVIVVAFGPRLFGWNRIGTSIAFPASMVMGYDKTLGTRNSAEEEIMLVMASILPPLLLKLSTMSLKDPLHTSPKLPLSAITVTSLGRIVSIIERKSGITPMLPSTAPP